MDEGARGHLGAELGLEERTSGLTFCAFSFFSFEFCLRFLFKILVVCNLVRQMQGSVCVTTLQRSVDDETGVH